MRSCATGIQCAIGGAEKMSSRALGWQIDPFTWYVCSWVCACACRRLLPLPFPPTMCLQHAPPPQGELSPAGKPHGNGRMISGDQEWVYSGEFTEGHASGVGEMIVGGSQIKGVFKEGRLAEGSCKLPSGLIYSGHPNADGCWMSDASKHTSTIQIRYPGGETFAGDLRDGTPHGVGTRTLASGRIYHGQFQHGRRHGVGRMVLASGENLQGSFVGRGSLDGEGTIHLRHGGEMTGTFSCGKLHGEGLYRASNGVEWRGTFVHSRLSGRASMTIAAEKHKGKEVVPAMTYEGQVSDDRAHGNGEVAFGALRCRGTWVEGGLDGQGALIEAHGRKGGTETIMLFRAGGRDDVFAEFGDASDDSDDSSNQ